MYTYEDEEREEFVYHKYRSVIPRDAARERRELYLLHFYSVCFLNVKWARYANDILKNSLSFVDII